MLRQILAQSVPGVVLGMAVNQATVRYVGRKMVNAVIADVGREPVQPARQHQIAGALDRAGLVIPAFAAAGDRNFRENCGARRS